MTDLRKRSLGARRSDHEFSQLNRVSAGTHLALAAIAGITVGVLVGVVTSLLIGLMAAWVTASAVFIVWSAIALWPMNATVTAEFAQREDASRVVRDVVLLIVSATSVLVLAVVVVPAHRDGLAQLILAIGCIAGSWLVVHTVFMLRYARLYYAAPVGGLDFPGDNEPTYRDFAYVAFTVGMTFQVSDTDVQEATIRSTVLRHALLSFVFGVVIVGVTINAIGGLSR